MMKLQQTDINLFWNEMDEHSWDSLSRVIANEGRHFDQDEITELLWAIDLLREEPFPEDSKELSEILNMELFAAPQRLWITYM